MHSKFVFYKKEDTTIHKKRTRDVQYHFFLRLFNAPGLFPGDTYTKCYLRTHTHDTNITQKVNLWRKNTQKDESI